MANGLISHYINSFFKTINSFINSLFLLEFFISVPCCQPDRYLYFALFWSYFFNLGISLVQTFLSCSHSILERVWFQSIKGGIWGQFWGACTYYISPNIGKTFLPCYFFFLLILHFIESEILSTNYSNLVISVYSWLCFSMQFPCRKCDILKKSSSTRKKIAAKYLKIYDRIYDHI